MNTSVSTNGQPQPRPEGSGQTSSDTSKVSNSPQLNKEPAKGQEASSHLNGILALRVRTWPPKT